MQAIAGLSRSLSRALVQGVVQRSQATEATQKPRPEAADTKLGETGCSPPLLAASLTTFPVLIPSQPTGLFSSFLLCVFLCPSFFFLHLHSFHCLILSGLNVFVTESPLPASKCRLWLHQNFTNVKQWYYVSSLVDQHHHDVDLDSVQTESGTDTSVLVSSFVLNFKLSNKPDRYL